MNPRNIGNFLKSKFGLLILFVIVLFAGLWMYGRHQTSEREAERLAAQSTKKIALGQVKVPLNQGLEDGVPQQAKVEKKTPAERETSSGAIVPFRPGTTTPATPALANAGSKTTNAPATDAKPRKVKYASLLASYDAPSTNLAQTAPPPPDRFIPFGTLLKCKLVNTIDSANLETPVIALLLEDVWQNGKKVIPANTLVHGTARSGRMRDRITASGAWHFVWHDGREMVFNGIALDREYEQDVDDYGITDGSGGIKGRVLATDDLQELKILASAALSGFARGTQDRTQNALGTTLTGSLSNGVREGAGEVFDLYAKRTLRDIEENGYFVRVPAGKEFYVYVLEAVDPQKASLAGVRLRASSTDAHPSPTNSPNENTKG